MTEKTLDRIDKQIGKIQEFLDGVRDKIDEIWIDDDIDAIANELAGKKLGKKEKRERGIEYIKNKLPNLHKVFEELRDLVNGINSEISELNSKLEDAESELENASETLSRVRDMKEEMDI